MDPALFLLEEGDPTDEVDVIARIAAGSSPPSGLRVVTRFGDIVTGRVARGSIREIRAHEAIESLKASRPVTYQDEDGGDAPLIESAFTRPDNRPGGSGIIVAIVDWGMDFASGNFRTPEGTRLLALFDQRDRPEYDGHPNRYGRGRIFTRAEIDAALRTPDPYETLGYHPADSDHAGGSHGTAVADIAAGNGRNGGPRGVACDADLIFVHLGGARPGARGEHELASNFGDTVGILEACDAIVRLAGGRPCVINLSMGQQGGPHDSTTLVELGLNQLLGSRDGLAIVHSCGNYANRRIHAMGPLSDGSRRRVLQWIVRRGDRSDNEMEIWYDGSAELAITLISPRGERYPLALGEHTDIVDAEGYVVGGAFHRARDPQNNDHHWDCYLYREAEKGTWEVQLDVVQPASGPDTKHWHAWIERDRGPQHQSHFPDADSVEHSTTGTIAHTPLGITVAAYDSRDPQRTPARFSSVGPARNGAMKPEIAAPGVNVVAARSTPRDADPAEAQLTRKSGTSMAAPAVTGTVALIMEAYGQPMPVRTVRQILFETASPAADPVSMRDRVGYGYLDIEAAVNRARAMSPARQHRSHRQRSALAIQPRAITQPETVIMEPADNPFEPDEKEILAHEASFNPNLDQPGIDLSAQADGESAAAPESSPMWADDGAGQMFGDDGEFKPPADAHAEPSPVPESSLSLADVGAEPVSEDAGDSLAGPPDALESSPMWADDGAGQMFGDDGRFVVPDNPAHELTVEQPELWVPQAAMETRLRPLYRPRAYPAETPAVFTVTDGDARIRTGPPRFAVMGRHRIPQYTKVLIAGQQDRYSRVTRTDGTALGWTATSNLGTYFKDTINAPTAPSTALQLQPAWSGRQRRLAGAYNRVGGLISAIAGLLGISVASVLGVWYVESAGRAHTPGRALIRFENHLFWRLWGRSNANVYDRHFQHGGRPPAVSAACRRNPSDPGSSFGAWKCHKYRPDGATAFVSSHVGNGQSREYEALRIATDLAGQDIALQCISIGGPQILIRHYQMIGYSTPRQMYDAFQAAERSHVNGFFDFCQYKLPQRRLLRYLRAQDWRNVARYYNGAGQVNRYSRRIGDAAADAALILRSPQGAR